MFNNYKLSNFWIIFLVATAYFIIHPQITEHVEYGLVESGIVKFTKENFLFNIVRGDRSMQITIPTMLLDFGFNKYIVQIILSWFFTLIPFFSIWSLVKSKDLWFSWAVYFSVLILLTNFLMPNWYFYPYSLSIGFFAFGNIGFWIFVLLFGLIIERKTIAYLVSGLLLGLHIPWGIAGSIVIISDFIKNDSKYKKLILFLIGLFGSAISIYIGNRYSIGLPSNLIEYSLIEKLNLILNFSKNEVTQFYAYSPFIWNNSHNPYFFYSDLYGAFRILFYLFFPTVILNLKISDVEIDIKREKIVYFINVLSLFVLIVLIYLEIARYVNLPFVQIFNRIITNRFLCLSNLVVIIFSISVILKSTICNKYKIDFWVYLASVFYLFQANIAVIIGSFIFLVIYFFIYKWVIKGARAYFIYKEIFLMLAVALFAFSSALIVPKNKYHAFTFLATSDPVIKYLMSMKEEEGDILIAPNVQSNNGLNVTLFSNKAYHMLGKLTYQNGENFEEVFCYKSSLGYENLVANANECFEKRMRTEWGDLFKQLGISSVIVPNTVKLDLDLMAQNDFLSVYTLNKR